MIKKYRILVDGQYYTGEKEIEFNTWHVDPWSKSSFQTKRQTRNILTFEPKANNNFKTVVGTINLLGEVKRIIEFCNYTELMAGNKIVIETEPYYLSKTIAIDDWTTRPIEDALNKRIAELEAENNRLAELLHNEKSQLEIATDLGNKRWTALNKIYEDGEKHNANWCKRMAQEGLGIKNA